jgi:hypothetical protein
MIGMVDIFSSLAVAGFASFSSGHFLVARVSSRHAPAK